MSYEHEDTEWRRGVASMTEQERSSCETECRMALGMCGDREDARSERP